MTVRELLGSLDSRELAEWAAYERIEPYGEERADLRSSIVACVIANANRGKNQPPFKVEDFMPKFTRRKPQDVKTMKKVLGL